MSEVLQEYVDSGSERLRVDRAAGIIRGVKLLGLTSRNGRRYREQALAGAVGLYEGAKVNINHPKGHPLAPRDYQDRLGFVRGVEFRPGQGLFGDLHFNPKHALSEQLVWDAEHAPQNVGVSHNVVAHTTRSGNDTVVEAITKVQSIDLVADPATTTGLFEHAEDGAVEEQRISGAADASKSSSPATSPQCSMMDLNSLTLEQLQQHRPDLLRELVQTHTTQLEQLRGERDALVTREQAARRREQIFELLQEYDLPLPSRNGALDSHLAGRDFIGTLMRAANDEAVRQLVEERAALVRSAWQWSNERRAATRRPSSRDQTPFESIRPVQNAQDFAAAIRGN
jgi:hypothetical protein